MAFLVKPAGAREIRNEIREIAVGGDAKPAINSTSILSMLSFHKVEIERGLSDVKRRLPTFRVRTFPK